MSARSGTALTLALLLGGLATAAAAQTTVSILNDGAAAPAPLKALEVADTDYPVASLLANEEGTATLGIQTGTDGKISAMQLVKSSGSPRLDQQAAALARARLAFRGAISAKLEVNWKLPLRPADDIYSQMIGFSNVGKSIVPPAFAPGTRMLTTDYSTLAVQNREEGEGAFRVQVLESGDAGDVQIVDSTGFKRLDDSAIAFLKRAKYEPGAVDGKPAAMTLTTTVGFVFSDTTKLGPLRFCHSQPIIGGRASVSAGAPEGEALAMNQWYHLIADGTIDDVVVLTERGWMHMSPPLVAAVSKAAGNTRASGPTYGVRTNSLLSVRRNGRPASCWYTVGRDRASAPPVDPR